MLESIVATVVVPGLIVLGGLVALSLRRRWVGGDLAAGRAPRAAAPSRRSRCVARAASTIVSWSAPARPWTTRWSSAGDTVTVDGTVTGNLIAAGHRVIVRGTVKGDLLAVAERVEIEGTVEGNVFAGGDTVLVRGSVGRSVHCGGDTVRVDASGRVDGDIARRRRDVDLDGRVGRDLVAFAGMTNVRGDVGRDASVRTRRLHLEAPATIGGNLVARVRDAAAVQVDEGAIVSGKTETRLAPEGEEPLRAGGVLRVEADLADRGLPGRSRPARAAAGTLFPPRLPAGARRCCARPAWASSRSSWCPRPRSS